MSSTSLTMSKAGGDGGEGAAGSSSEKAQQPEDKATEVKLPGKLSATTIGPGWTKVTCPCCVAERVEPLVLVKLGPKVRPETKRWLIRLIGAPQEDGGKGSNNSDWAAGMDAKVHVFCLLIVTLQTNTCRSNIYEHFSDCLIRNLLTTRVTAWKKSSIKTFDCICIDKPAGTVDKLS